MIAEVQRHLIRIQGLALDGAMSSGKDEEKWLAARKETEHELGENERSLRLRASCRRLGQAGTGRDLPHIQDEENRSAARGNGQGTPRAGSPNYNFYADVNGDGVVNITDLAFVPAHLPTATKCQ